MRACLYFTLASLIIIAASQSHANPLDQQALEDWFNNDSEVESLAVNEGQLKFIEPVFDKPVLHSKNTLHVTQESLTTGWVALQQCYSQLDAVSEIDIVYQYKAMRGLTIGAINNIGRAEVIGQSVRLHQVKQQAELCITAEIQVANKIDASFYQIISGPFHRRFLDGFYPYHVSLDIHYPEEILNLVQTQPAQHAYQRFIAEPGHMSIDAWFEGILKFKITFQLIVDKNN